MPYMPLTLLGAHVQKGKNRMARKYGLLIFGALLAGACSTSSDPDSGEDGTEQPLASFTFLELSDELVGLTADIDAEDVTLEGALPDTGTRTYDGVLSLLFEDNNTEGVIGTAELRANFRNDTVTGRAGNFSTLDAQPTAGEISFENGEITRITAAAPVVITSEIEGTVTFTPGEMDVTGETVGSLFGTTGNYLLLSVTGTADPANGPDISLEGAVVAERR